MVSTTFLNVFEPGTTDCSRFRDDGIARNDRHNGCCSGSAARCIFESRPHCTSGSDRAESVRSGACKVHVFTAVLSLYARCWINTRPMLRILQTVVEHACSQGLLAGRATANHQGPRDLIPSLCTQERCSSLGQGRKHIYIA